MFLDLFELREADLKQVQTHFCNDMFVKYVSCPFFRVNEWFELRILYSLDTF